eukprot:COSAG01_NODE_17789_length_1124_cov_1.111220_1_plen_355_part_01
MTHHLLNGFLRALFGVPAPEDEEFLQTLINKDQDDKQQSAKQTVITDVYHKVYVPFGGWESLPEQDAKDAWKYAVPMKNRAQQVREELFPSQDIHDRESLFTETGKVDMTIQTASRRTQAGLALKALFAVESLVAEPWQLPVLYVAAINAQINARDQDRGIVGSFAGAYKLFEAVNSSVKAPTGPRRRGSALQEAIKKVMSHFGMEECWDGGSKSAYVETRDLHPDGSSFVRKLRSGYGFKPINQGLAERYHIHVPILNKRVAVADLPVAFEHVDQERYEAEMEAVRAYDLPAVCGQARVLPGAKEEIFDYDKLKELHAKVTADPVAFEVYMSDKIDPKTGQLKTKEERVQSMIG